jgi:hypothetical protein
MNRRRALVKALLSTALACAPAMLGQWHGYIDAIGAAKGSPLTQDVTFSVCDDKGTVQQSVTATVASPINKDSLAGTINHAVWMTRYPVPTAPTPSAGATYAK